MTFDKESSYENLIDKERRRDKAIEKLVLTPLAPQKATGTRDTINPLRLMEHLGKRKVGHPH